MVKAQNSVDNTSRPTSFGMAAISGIIWTIVQTLCGRASGFIGQLILAKILVPEDFGILGLAYTIIIFVSMLTNVGIDQVLIQRQPRMHLWATQAFWIILILATIAAITMAAFAPIAAKLYHNEKITSVIWIMALSTPISALVTLPWVKLRSMMRFKFLSAYYSIEAVIAQIMTILLALGGFGAISFVLPIPLLAAVRALVFWRIAPLPLRPLRLSKGWSKMLKRGSGVFGAAVLTTSIGQGDYMILGVLASAQVVGIYFFAFKLAAQPMLTLASSFNGVLGPTLIAISGEPVRQRDAALRTAEVLGVLTIPICFFQAAVAKPGLTLLFGTQWLESIPLVQILSIGLPLDAVSWAAGALLAARGQFGRSFKYQLISAPFFFMFVTAGALLGSATGVAIGVAIYYTIHPILYTAIVFCKEGISIVRVLSCFYTPALLSFITIGTAYGISLAPIFHDFLILQIVVISLFGGFMYLLGVRHFSPLIYNDVQAKVRGFLQRKSKLSDMSYKLRPFVVIATKGRPAETARLMDYLQRQILQPVFTVVVGTEVSDLVGVDSHPWIVAGHGAAVISPRIGLTAQRNFGLETLEQRGYLSSNAGRYFCAFFDDDYRLADDWLKHAEERLAKGDVVGLSGRVLSDGMGRGGLTESQAIAFLKGETPPDCPWGDDDEDDMDSVYGCNMAFVDTVISVTRFDEALPLYSWHEDRDYTGMAKRLGRVIFFPGCRGVHLGVSGGRVNDVRFGYSQIANALYLMRKGTMGYFVGLKIIGRALAANIIRSVRGHHPYVGYRGRLRGNLHALLDVVCLRSDPSRLQRRALDDR
jgi:O-antigen/teichoic acid export membrane protein